MNLMESTIASIREPDEQATAKARARQAILTKPSGSLGVLEDLAVKIAGITRKARPQLAKGIVFIMAGDHGVCAEGVSAYPSEVTAQMVLNILAGGACINVFARYAGMRVVVSDIGVASELQPAPGLYLKKVRPGTGNIACGPAMSREEAQRSIEAGIEVFEDEYAKEAFSIVATGDMGIGNTTPSTALASLFTGKSPALLAGRGTGIDDASLARKISVVERALFLNTPRVDDPLGALAAIGGLEIGAITGIILASAARGIPVLLDGFISGAGALVAKALAPRCTAYMIAAHASADSGHRAMLESLDLEPILDLGLRLGEGTGAVLAYGICDAACRSLDEMTTFGEAGVAERE